MQLPSHEAVRKVVDVAVVGLLAAVVAADLVAVVGALERVRRPVVGEGWVGV